MQGRGGGLSCFGDEGNRQGQEESGKTSIASDGCFIKALLCLLGIPTVYLASFIQPPRFPKGAKGNFFPPKYTNEVSAATQIFTGRPSPDLWTVDTHTVTAALLNP